MEVAGEEVTEVAEEEEADMEEEEEAGTVEEEDMVEGEADIVVVSLKYTFSLLSFFS